MKNWEEAKSQKGKDSATCEWFSRTLPERKIWQQHEKMSIWKIFVPFRFISFYFMYFILEFEVTRKCLALMQYEGTAMAAENSTDEGSSQRDGSAGYMSKSEGVGFKQGEQSLLQLRNSAHEIDELPLRPPFSFRYQCQGFQCLWWWWDRRAGLRRSTEVFSGHYMKSQQSGSQTAHQQHWGPNSKENLSISRDTILTSWAPVHRALRNSDLSQGVDGRIDSRLEVLLAGNKYKVADTPSRTVNFTSSHRKCKQEDRRKRLFQGEKRKGWAQGRLEPRT